MTLTTKAAEQAKASRKAMISNNSRPASKRRVGLAAFSASLVGNTTPASRRSRVMVNKDTRNRGTASRAMASKGTRRKVVTADIRLSKGMVDILSRVMEAAMAVPHLGSMGVGISSSRLREVVDSEPLVVQLWA